jgi:uncharacterized membrane protein
MKTTDALIHLSIATLLVINSAKALAASQPGMEKCSGIVKAGMNDCETAGAACASSAKHDRQRDAFVFLPKGICERIVGGELTAK